jgi:polyhydroxybutyrate depolymerase
MRVVRAVLIGVGVAAAIAVALLFRVTQPMAGTSERQLVVDGVTRRYLLHAAGAAKPGRSLVLVLHGWGGSAPRMEHRTRGTFDRLADRDGAVVAYPAALGRPSRWNDGWNMGRRGVTPPDDVRFLSALIDTLVAEFGVDRNQVFAAGLSNGASMVYRLACERPELVAAVAPVSGGMPAHLVRASAQGAPVSILGMHGTDDPLVPFDQSIRDGVSAWVKRDGCPAQPSSSRLPDSDPSDGTQTRVDAYAPCASATEVAFYTIEGGGHAWPGGDPPWFRRRGRTARDFDAGVVIWDFFQKHRRR